MRHHTKIGRRSTQLKEILWGADQAKAAAAVRLICPALDVG
jgi:hypothetical protein